MAEHKRPHIHVVPDCVVCEIELAEAERRAADDLAPARGCIIGAALSGVIGWLLIFGVFYGVWMVI